MAQKPETDTTPTPAQAPEVKAADFSAEENPFNEDLPEYDLEEGDYNPRGVLDSEGSINLEAKREDVRGRLAIIYTVATFIMFVLGFVVAVIDAVTRQVPIVNSLQTILPLISGIFLGSLGFVLGYYFRKVENDRKD
jgi:hypothetical protein